MNETVPMPSARLEPGRYLVLGTSHECIVEKGSVPSPFGANSGWNLYCNGEHVKGFLSKREALQYCQEHPEL